MFARIILVSIITFLGYSQSFAMSSEAEKNIEILKSTDTALRRSAAANLSNLRSREAVPALIKALKDKDFGVRSNAANALGNLRDVRAVEPLIKLLKDENRSVRVSAIVSLGFIRDKRAIQDIIKILKKEQNTGVKISATQVLGVLGDDSAVKELLNVLSDSDKRVRSQAARSLGRLKATSAVGPLGDMLDDKAEKKEVKKYIIEALGEIVTAKSTAKLKKALNSKDPLISVNAASALGKHGEKTGLHVAIKSLSSEDVNVRRDAVMALSNIGIKNDEVSKALIKALDDSDSRVKSRAKFAMNSLGVDLEKKKGN